MTNESFQRIGAEALVIAERLGDPKGLLFYCFAVRKLGSDRCFRLCSVALEAARNGYVKTSAARYFNGCVKKEIRETNTHEKVRPAR